MSFTGFHLSSHVCVQRIAQGDIISLKDAALCPWTGAQLASDDFQGWMHVMRDRLGVTADDIVWAHFRPRVHQVLIIFNIMTTETYVFYT